MSAATTPELAGLPKAQLDTPALLLDLDRFESNSRRLKRFLDDCGVAWRPHSKAHKSPDIAQRQLALGAVGVTCAKAGEAEVMVASGITSVLIANELASRAKLDRVARLQDRAEVLVCADDPVHVEMAGAAGTAHGVEIPMLVEVDIGMERCGTAPGRASVDLARLIARTPGVRFVGVMGYEGHVVNVWPYETKATMARTAIAHLVDTARLIEQAGLPVAIVSGGGSGSYMFTGLYPGVTEVQAGGACLMDLFYAEECHLAEMGYEFALTIVATVTSRPTRDRAVIDAGFKSISGREGVLPRLVGVRGVEVAYLSAEHGVLRLAPDAEDLRIGDRVELIPDYSDTTTFRHDQFVALRGDVVERVIPLLARGRLT